MRRLNICEERGTGIGKVVDAVEAYELPAPVFETPPGSTRALLFAHKPFREMDRHERLHACYMHALPPLRDPAADDERVSPQAVRDRREGTPLWYPGYFPTPYGTA